MKWILCCMMMLSAAAVYAQGPQFAYRIYFKDKSGSPQTGSAASFLSARALARRTAQGIAVDSTDRPVSPLYLDTVIALAQGKFHNASRWMNSCVILMSDSSRMALIRSKPYVLNTVWVGYWANGLHRPEPALHGASVEKGTGTPAFYNNTWTQTSIVNGDYLHDLGFRGEGKLIAVLDLGFLDVNHHPGFDSLRTNGRILDTWNFVLDSSDVYRYTAHGTQALSTMAGYIPNTFVGTAPKAEYALYITDDYTISDARYETDNLIAGMERADSLGADIISTSTGYNEFFLPTYFIYPKATLGGNTIDVSRAANMATGKGMLVVAAAGNEGGNPWNYLLAPGDADSVLTVGAINSAKVAATFTSPGPNAAGRIKPDVCAIGDPALTLSGMQGMGGASGTSFSTPQIAGWAACLWQARSGARPYNLRKAIDESADHYMNPGPAIGYGVPDFKKAYQSLGLNDPGEGTATLDVWPNPVQQRFEVHIPDYAPAQISYQIVDVAGKVIAAGAATSVGSKVSMSLPSSMPGGVYMLRLQAGEQHFTAKIIKN